jgi:hypothetical protein
MGKGTGGFWLNSPPFIPYLATDRGRGRAAAQEGRPVGGCPPATLATAAAGRWGKMERRPRGIDSRAHLVLEWSEEAAPREGSGSAAVLGGGGAVEFGERGGGAVRLCWCGAASRGGRRPLL